jgi:hypothetical protein
MATINGRLLLGTGRPSPWLLEAYSAWGVDQWHVPGWFDWYLRNGARRLQQLADGLSKKQKQVSQDKLWEVVHSDPDAVAESDLFKAFATDLGLFGDVVFNRDNDEEPQK